MVLNIAWFLCAPVEGDVKRMNKKINAIFTGLGLLSQIFYLWNAFNIWFRHIGISLSQIYDSLFKILVVVVGFVLVIISMIFHRDNYKIVNIGNAVVMKGVSMKKKILHIIVPILLTVVAYFVCTKAFYIPDPTKPNTATWVTDAISIGVSIFTLGVSAIISAILYVGSKKK